jgi:tRNA(Arg) A34 adenosine deaminase TadA
VNLAVDDFFLRRAVQLALDNVQTQGGGPFGAVVVYHGKVIAEGCNQVVAHHDPTAHAEVVALRRAGEVLKTFDLAGCTLYASSEPCPMCLAAAYWGRIERIVFANSVAEAAAVGFDDVDFYRELSLPTHERRLPMLHLPFEGSLEPLKRWLANPQRVRY